MFTFQHQSTLFFFLLMGFAIPLSAAPEIQAKLTPPQMPLGETATLQIDAQWPQTEAQYKFMIPTFILNNLEVHHQAEAHEYFIQDGANWVRKTMTFILKPKMAGTGTVERFRFSYIDPVVQKGGSQELGPFEIRILSAAGQSRFKFFPWVLSALFAAIALGIWRIRQWKQKRQTAAVASGPKPLQRELNRLHAMQTQHAEGTHQASLQETSEIFKKVLIEFYGLSIAETAGSEILKALGKKGLTRDEIKPIRDLSERLTEAKYSGSQFSEFDFDDLCRAMMQFVESRQSISSANLVPHDD